MTTLDMTRSGEAPIDRRPVDAGRRLLVVHEQEIVLLGCRALFGRQSWVERCVVASDLAAAAALAARYEPHLALVQVRDLSVAARATAEIRRAHPLARVALIAERGRLTPSDARAAGAVTAIDSSCRASEILEQARALASGLPAPTVAPPAATAAELLSPRERQVLGYLATGATNREIGRRLVLSPDTIKNHVSRAYRKLGARNRLEAVNRARELGLLT